MPVVCVYGCVQCGFEGFHYDVGCLFCARYSVDNELAGADYVVQIVLFHVCRLSAAACACFVDN